MPAVRQRGTDDMRMRSRHPEAPQQGSLVEFLESGVSESNRPLPTCRPKTKDRDNTARERENINYVLAQLSRHPSNLLCFESRVPGFCGVISIPETRACGVAAVDGETCLFLNLRLTYVPQVIRMMWMTRSNRSDKRML